MEAPKNDVRETRKQVVWEQDYRTRSYSDNPMIILALFEPWIISNFTYKIQVVLHFF